MKARVPMQSQPARRTPASALEGAVRRTSGASFDDNRPAAVAQRQLAEGINAGATQRVMRVAHESIQNSPRMSAQRLLACALPASPQAAQRVEEEEPLQATSAVTQRAEDEELLQGKSGPIQRQEPEEEEPLQGRFGTAQRLAEPARPINRTGLPDPLKTGIESLSGLSMDHVKVHYSSAQPAQLNALAYAQGSDIHVAPGQERHLPHEAWHIVQQAQGRVRPTMQMKAGVAVNDDQRLEREADVMGSKAAAMDQGAGPAQLLDGPAEPAEANPGKGNPGHRAQEAPLISPSAGVGDGPRGRLHDMRFRNDVARSAQSRAELGHARPVAVLTPPATAVHSGSTVQRWGDDAAQPGGQVDWAAEPGIMFAAPAGGASGGVMVVTNAAGQTLIVKPESNRQIHPSAVTAADKFFSGGRFNVRSPVSRIVTNSSPEFAQLQARLAAHAPAAAAEVHFFKVMESVGVGSTDVHRMIKGANAGNAPVAALGNLLSFMTSRSLWRQIGRVAVGDMFIFNNDRFTHTKANFGNLMRNAQGRYYSIDVEVGLGGSNALEQMKGGHPHGRFVLALENLRVLFANPLAIYSFLFEGVLEVAALGIPDVDADLLRASAVAGSAAARDAFMNGINLGKNDLKALLMDESFLASMREEFGRSFKDQEGHELQGSRQSWTLFEAQKCFFLTLLEGGGAAAAQEAAMAVIQPQVQEQQRRTFRDFFSKLGK